jgi:hypothetical protein
VAVKTEEFELLTATVRFHNGRHLQASRTEHGPMKEKIIINLPFFGNRALARFDNGCVYSAQFFMNATFPPKTETNLGLISTIAE